MDTTDNPVCPLSHFSPDIGHFYGDITDCPARNLARTFGEIGSSSVCQDVQKSAMTGQFRPLYRISPVSRHQWQDVAGPLLLVSWC